MNRHQIRTEYCEGYGGARLAVHRMGDGEAVVMLHGLFSNAVVNWITYGHAARVAAAGYEVIMPDLRAHGQSDAPHDPAAYPPDVLVADLRAVIEGMSLYDYSRDYNVVGYSLGARTALKCAIEGYPPRRLVLAGLGVQALDDWGGRAAHFIEVIDRFGTVPRDDPKYFIQQFMKSTEVDLVAARLLLQSLEGSRIGAVSRLLPQTLVLCGEQDRDNGDPEALAEALPGAQYRSIPGTHMSCVTKRELGEAIVQFLLE